MTRSIQQDSESQQFWAIHKRLESLESGYGRLALAHNLRANTLMHGGGRMQYRSGAGVAWASRFIYIGGGKGAPGGSSGFFDIVLPPDGTLIPNESDGSTVEVGNPVSGFVPLNVSVGWGALWYELPLGDTSASRPENFRVTQYSVGVEWDVPDNWALVASVHSGSVVGQPTHARFGNGMLLAGPYVVGGSESSVGFVNSYQGLTGWQPPEYIWMNNHTYLQGVATKNGTQVNAETIFTLPVGFCPIGHNIFATGAADNAVSADGVDVFSSGVVRVRGPGTGGLDVNWVSLSGVNFQTWN